MNINIISAEKQHLPQFFLFFFYLGRRERGLFDCFLSPHQKTPARGIPEGDHLLHFFYHISSTFFLYSCRKLGWTGRGKLLPTRNSCAMQITLYNRKSILSSILSTIVHPTYSSTAVVHAWFLLQLVMTYQTCTQPSQPFFFFKCF